MTGLLVSAFNAFHRWRQGTALLYLRIKDDLRAGRRVAEQDGERCESGHRACLRIGAADRDYVRNCADRDDVRCLRIGTTSDELGIYEWDAGAGRTTNIKDLRSGRVASGRPSNYLRIYERDACETPCPFYYGCNRRRTATRSGPDDGFCDGRFTRSKRWLMWSWTTRSIRSGRSGFKGVFFSSKVRVFAFPLLLITRGRLLRDRTRDGDESYYCSRQTRPCKRSHSQSYLSER